MFRGATGLVGPLKLGPKSVFFNVFTLRKWIHLFVFAFYVTRKLFFGFVAKKIHDEPIDLNSKEGEHSAC